MFIGRFLHTIDSKGRLSIPMQFREVLADRYEEKLIITTDLDPCLVAFPIEEWRLIEEKAKNLPMMQKEVKDFFRIFYSGAVICSLDRQGRVLIPPSQREYAKLSREVTLIGMNSKIEVWDSKKWKEHVLEVPRSSEKIGETLAHLGL